MLQRIIYYGNAGWGDAVYYRSTEKPSIYGWKPYYLPSDTCMIDAINKTDDGYCIVYLLKNIKWCNDPRDMFFADIVNIGRISSDSIHNKDSVIEAVRLVYDNYMKYRILFYRIKRWVKKFLHIKK